jgi:hypothetical protein
VIGEVPKKDPRFVSHVALQHLNSPEKGKTPDPPR